MLHDFNSESVCPWVYGGGIKFTNGKAILSVSELAAWEDLKLLQRVDCSVEQLLRVEEALRVLRLREKLSRCCKERGSD